MPMIRPCADLRNNYNEISKICHKTKEPVFITKNGTNDLVVLSDEAYNKMQQSSEEKIERLVAEKFEKHYNSFEELKKDIEEQIDEALKEIEEGKGIPMEQAVKEMEAKYGFHRPE